MAKISYEAIEDTISYWYANCSFVQPNLRDNGFKKSKDEKPIISVADFIISSDEWLIDQSDNNAYITLPAKNGGISSVLTKQNDIKQEINN